MSDVPGEATGKKLKGRGCYGHLGGTIGARLFDRLVALGWFAPEENKATVYEITALGEEKLTELGVDIYEKRK